MESALAACTVITLRLYAARKLWPVAAIIVTVTLQRQGNQTSFTRNISVNGDIAPEQLRRLLEIAKACPVSKTLSGNISVNTDIA